MAAGQDLNLRPPGYEPVGWCAIAHDELGLLRLDVDGETFYKYEEPDEDGDEDDVADNDSDEFGGLFENVDFFESKE